MIAVTGRRAWQRTSMTQASMGCRVQSTIGPVCSLSTRGESSAGHSSGIPPGLGVRSFVKDALDKTCYDNIGFGISEHASVYEAVERFAAYNVGALAVLNAEGRAIGVVTERDYVSKIALLGRPSKTTPVKNIATMGTAMIVASTEDTIQACMAKMVSRDIRHLPVVDKGSGHVLGLLSIKDLLKEISQEKEEIANTLAELTNSREIGHEIL